MWHPIRGLLFLCWLIAIPTICVLLWMRWGKHTQLSNILWSTALIALIMLPLVYVFATNVIVNNFARPSRIDVSPLSLLCECQIASVEDALLRLNSEGGVRILNVDEFPENHFLVRRYSVLWISDSQTQMSSSLSMTVHVNRRKERAISDIHLGILRRQLYSHIQHDNDTEAVLQHPWMPVSGSGWYIPSDDRLLLSNLRVGHVTFSMRETRRWYDIHNDYSSQFIAALVEALQESTLQKP